MSVAAPRLKPDLVVSRHETAEGLFFVIKDPVSGQFFRFREAELFITQQLDGATPLEAIRRRTEERFASALPDQTFTEFIAALGRHGLLENGRAAPERPRLRRNGPLYMRYALFNPDRLLSAIERPLRFFFTPAFVAFAAITILTALAITTVSLDQMVRDIAHLNWMQAIALAWVAVLTVGTLHEFAHGLTCKHFGGEVREMGFLLLYFHPALYANVSDAWLFTRKSQRLWVTFAGVGFELFLWACATIVWRVADVGTWPSRIALVVMATSGIKTLFNFNPLMRLDGYYLLSDMLGIPNLRQRSLRYIGASVSRLWRGAEAEPDVTERERRVYLLYGGLAALFTIVFLGVIVLKLGGQLMGRFQAIGLFLFLAFVPVVGRYRLRRLAPMTKGMFQGTGNGAATPAPSRGKAPPGTAASSAPSPAKPRAGVGGRLAPFTSRRALLIGTAALALILFAGFMELKVTGEFTVMPTRTADVRAEVDGLIEEVFVDEGQRVRPGDPIARLSDRDLRNELMKTQAALGEKQQRWQMLGGAPPLRQVALNERDVPPPVGPAMPPGSGADDRSAVARAAIQRAADELRYARANLTRIQALKAADVVSGRDLEDAQQNVALKQRELESARAGLGEEMVGVQSEVGQLQAQASFLADQIGRVRMTTPIAGVVTTPTRTLRELQGRYVKQGDLIAEVDELGALEAEIAIPEKEIADVKVGERVVLRARAYPQRTFTGRVTAIAMTAQAPDPGTSLAGIAGGAAAQRNVLVTTRLDDAALLKPQMTGKAKILCGRHTIFSLIGRRLARTFKVEFWSWW